MRKEPSQARSKATVDAILSAATRILLSAGYAEASTNKIADLAGVSIGSLYEYFPGKEAIFAELRRRTDQVLFDLVMQHDEPQTLSELVRAHVTLYLEFVRANLALHAALINDVPQFAVDQEELPVYRDYVPWVAAFLKRHEEELQPDCDIEKLADFVIRVSRATIDNYVLHAPEALRSSLIDRLMVDLLEGYLLKSSVVSV